MMMYEFRLNFTDVCPGPNNSPGIGLHNGLAPTRQQAIIWTNDDKITDEFMRHSASIS